MDYDLKEFSITVKQATSLLMLCKHDFKLFVAELLVVKDNQIKLRNLVSEVFNPVKQSKVLIGEEELNLNQTSSYSLAKRSSDLARQHGPPN